MKALVYHIVRSRCRLLLFMIGWLHFSATANAHAGRKIVVDLHGKGDFASIQAAINSLPDSSAITTTILIKKGVYREKIFIQKSNIIIEGEDRNATIIMQSIARDEWRCLHKDDWGVATMNVDGNDITLKNLTIVNNYGFEQREAVEVPCAADSVKHEKLIANTGHQMALRTMNTTRLRAINCTFKAFGGDTVSPWNVNDGMFYFKNCDMEGGVDFYCPRGWAYAENCHFVAHNGPASIWHDGSAHPDSKTVLVNCTFDGFEGFKLGRYHKDAQFFLINCRFSKAMADQDIYLVPTTNVIQWGRRVYYYNCHRDGGDYAWHKNNMQDAPDVPPVKEITAGWVFKGKWHPEKNL